LAIALTAIGRGAADETAAKPKAAAAHTTQKLRGHRHRA
jgi:hypothetical protein